MTTLEQHRDTRTGAVDIMPFDGWDAPPVLDIFGYRETLFRFPAADDPSPAPARLLSMSIVAALIGLAGAGVGFSALLTLLGGATAWYVPTLALLGIVSVALVVGSFLSIHRPVLPWLLLVSAGVPITADVLIALN